MKFVDAYKSFESLNDRGKYIFDIVQKKGPITKSELIDMTKIKLTTLNRDIQILIDKNLNLLFLAIFYWSANCSN